MDIKYKSKFKLFYYRIYKDYRAYAYVMKWVFQSVIQCCYEIVVDHLESSMSIKMFHYA